MVKIISGKGFFRVFQRFVVVYCALDYTSENAHRHLWTARGDQSSASVFYPYTFVTADFLVGSGPAGTHREIVYGKEVGYLHAHLRVPKIDLDAAAAPIGKGKNRLFHISTLLEYHRRRILPGDESQPAHATEREEHRQGILHYQYRLTVHRRMTNRQYIGCDSCPCAYLIIGSYLF